MSQQLAAVARLESENECVRCCTNAAYADVATAAAAAEAAAAAVSEVHKWHYDLSNWLRLHALRVRMSVCNVVQRLLMQT